MYWKSTLACGLLIMTVLWGCAKNDHTGQEADPPSETEMEGRDAHTGSEPAAGTETEGLDSDTGSESEQGPEKKEEQQETSTEKKLIHIKSIADFKERILKADKPCLADFYSNECPPCRMLAPVIQRLADEYKGKAVISKVSLDITANRGLAGTYGIRGIPTVIFFSKGKEVNRLVGMRPEQAYRDILDKIVAEKTGTE